MPRRHEAKPTRRPRVCTLRLVLVSLVFGVVLAVGSLPASIAFDRVGWPSTGGARHEQYVLYGGWLIGIEQTRIGIGSTWSHSRSDASLVHNGFAPANVRSAKRVTVDPRPYYAQAWLDTHGGFVISYRTGWPFDAAYGCIKQATQQEPTMYLPSPQSVEGLWDASVGGRRVMVPYLPYWPGLLGNTLFYALVVLALLGLLRRYKLRRRARRGLCLACAYELGEGVEACPECGLARAASR
ncbi:MAG: hypothetical protein AAFV77_06125 [Planctomycetota bacterium]